MTDVTCAIIRDDDAKVLVVQRGGESDHPFKWEFPGGKTQQGESYEDCIIREIKEELSIDIIICSLLEPVEYDYGFKQIRLIPFVCDTLRKEPVLNEHIDYRWVGVEELLDVNLQEADVIVTEKYLKYINFQKAERTDLKKEKEGGEQDDWFDEKELKEIIDNLMYQKQVHWLAESAFSNPGIFRKLLEYSFSDNKRLAFRSSWVLTKVCDKHPDLIKPHLNNIIHELSYFNNNSVIRSFMRILSMADMAGFSEEEHGILANYCLERLNSRSPVAIKSYCMEILSRLVVKYPELGNEIVASVRSVMEEGSPGIVSKGKKILRKITGITSDS